MKNRVSILILLIFLLFSLVACARDEDNKTDESNTEATQSEQKDVNNEANKPQKDENGNYILDEVGQKVEDPESGTAELLKIKEVNETVDVSPLKVTVTDMKVIKVTDLNADYKEMMEFNTEESIGEDFTYLQISFSAENVEDRNIDWLDIETLVLSNGQQIAANSKDFIIDEGDSDYTFYGKVKKDYTTSVIIKDENIDNVKIIFSITEDSTTAETITDQQQVEFSFE